MARFFAATPDIFGNPAVEVQRMRRREITMSPAWHARRHRQLERELAMTIPPDPNIAHLPFGARPKSGPRVGRGPDRTDFAIPPRAPGEDRDAHANNSGPSSLAHRSPSSNLPHPVHRENRKNVACQPGQPCGLEDREWGLNEIIDMREGDAGVEYLVRWTDSKLDRRHVRTRLDGSKHIACRGREWSIRSVVDAVDGEAQTYVMVTWEDSWCDEAGFKESHDTILAFEATQGVDNGAADDSSSADDQLDELNTAFKPLINVDYGPIVREMVQSMSHPIRDVTTLLNAATVRETTFRSAFAEDERIANLARASKRNAILAHSSGWVQSPPCRRCARGHGPFEECVAGIDGGTSCTNCRFEEKGPLCDFHPGNPEQRLIVKQHLTVGQSDDTSSEAASTSTASASIADHDGLSSSQRNSPCSVMTEPTSPSDGRMSLNPAAAGSAPEGTFEPARGGSHATPGLTDVPPPNTRGTQRSLVDLQGREDSPRPHTPPIRQGRKRRASSAATTVRDRPTDLELSRWVTLSPTPTAEPTRRYTVPNLSEAQADPHAHCRGKMASCIAYDVRPLLFPHVADHSALLDMVYSEATFGRDQATMAQVRFILRRLSCANADYFEEHWQSWLALCRRRCEQSKHTKETYLSHFLWDRLNEVVEHCPRRPGAVTDGLGSTASEPIVIA